MPLYKMSLNQDTNEFFKSEVLSEKPGVTGPQIVSAQRLSYAREQISEYLSKESESSDDPEKWLYHLYSKVTSQLHFNLYEVDDAAEVGIIFEVVNDRGKPLTNLEKVKNYLLYVASTLDVQDDARKEFTDSVNNKWGDILTQLMAAGLSYPSDEDQLLRSHWLMRYDPQSKNWDGSKSIKNRFDLRKYKGKSGEMLKVLHEYIDGLRDACVCFCDARMPLRSGAFNSFAGVAIGDEVKLWNSKLVRIGIIAPFLPLLMSVRIRWPSEPEKYLEVLRLCEAFAFRVYRLRESRSDAGQAALFRLGYEVAHESMDFEDIISRLKQELAHRCGDNAYESLMGTDHQQWKSKYGWAGLRYFLYEYETFLTSKLSGSPKVSWEELLSSNRKDTIEHILPRSIERPYWKERFDSNTHREYLHDIGNLTLTKGNPSLSDKAFPEKKKSEGYCYEKSLLTQERDIANKWDEWTTDSIDERRAILMEWAKKRWYVDFGDSDSVTYVIDEEDVDEEDEE